jgi:hypothetical protein
MTRQDRHGENDISDIRQTNAHAWLEHFSKGNCDVKNELSMLECCIVEKFELE